MPTKDDLSDDYVARILSRDAKAISTKYSVYGLQELLPRRCLFIHVILIRGLHDVDL